MSRSPLLLGARGERASATQIAAARIIIGGSALVTTGLARVVFGLPAEQDSPAARFLGRAFGIRNIVLGAWTLRSRDADIETRRFCYRANLAVDAVDIGILVLPLVRRQGIDRFAIMSLSLAIGVTLAWTDLLGLAREEALAAAA